MTIREYLHSLYKGTDCRIYNEQGRHCVTPDTTVEYNRRLRGQMAECIVRAIESLPPDLHDVLEFIDTPDDNYGVLRLIDHALVAATLFDECRESFQHIGDMVVHQLVVWHRG